MQTTTYRVEMDADKHPFLVEDRKFEYGISCIRSPEDIVDLINHTFRLRVLAEEYVCQVALNSQGNILGLFEVSHGTINSSQCNPREIFLRAIVSGASSIVVIHNHPSGNTSPSNEDIVVSKKLYEAGKLLGVSVEDFIIIGDKSYYSFKEKCMIE